MSTKRFSNSSIDSTLALAAFSLAAWIIVVGIGYVEHIPISIQPGDPSAIVRETQRAFLVNPQVAVCAVTKVQSQGGTGLDGLDFDPVNQALQFMTQAMA